MCHVRLENSAEDWQDWYCTDPQREKQQELRRYDKMYIIF